MSITDIFGESFDTIWKYPKAILPYLVMELVISLLVIIAVFELAGMAVATGIISASFWALIIGIIAMSFVIGMFITPLFYGVYTNIEVQKLKKKRFSLRAAYNSTKARYGTLFWAGLANLAIYLVIVIVFAGLLLGYIGANGPVLAALGAVHAGTAHTSALRPLATLAGFLLLWAVLLILCTGIAAVFLFQYVPIAILEGRGALDSIKRSFEVGRKNFWSILGALVIYMIIVLLVYFVVGIISTPFDLASRTVGSLVQILISSVVGSFVYPWYIMIMTSFYNSYVRKIAQ